MFVSTFADSIGVGRPGFGIGQLSGLIIGALVTLAGLVKVLFRNSRILVRLLAGIYLGGIIYMGLRPYTFKSVRYKVLLDFNSFSWHDFTINTTGFIPLGYLFMLSFGNREKDRRSNLLYRAIMVAGFGSLVSLFLEMSQYYLISGRASSLFDWISNTFGTLLGIAAYRVLSTKSVVQ